MDEISQYKYIIHSRFDQFYVDYHPKYTGDKIWIPKVKINTVYVTDMQYFL